MQEEIYGEPLLDDVDRPMLDDEEDEDHFLARLAGRGQLEAVIGDEGEPETEWDGE